MSLPNALEKLGGEWKGFSLGESASITRRHSLLEEQVSVVSVRLGELLERLVLDEGHVGAVPRVRLSVSMVMGSTL